ncbi:MAG: DUF550 domain-containing protein [Nevskiaceae bacterium]|nr:MAG: DUF550 domain-containing protein [Nevskiaceae bacterium]
MNTPNEFSRPEGAEPITTPHQRFLRIRELIPHLPPLPWQPGNNSNVSDANGAPIVDTVQWTETQGFGPANDAMAEALVHLSFLIMPPGHVASTLMGGTDHLIQLQNDVHEMANKLFPHRKQSSAFLKLYGEVGEVIDNPTDPGEWADVFILLLDLARINGIDVEQAVRDKMRILQKREWEVNPVFGTFQHRRDKVVTNILEVHSHPVHTDGGKTEAA